MRVLLFLFSFFSFSFSNDKPTILWLMNDVPPFYITEGKYKGEGIGDLTQKSIINNLKEYNHVIQKTTLKRALKDFKYAKKVCFSTWIHNSTPNIVITSLPNIYYPPLGIITRKENKDKFLDVPVSLEKLMSNKKLYFIQGAGRGYSSSIDKIVNKYKGKENFKIRTSSQNVTNGIFEMIKRKRVDYTIDYYSSLSFYESSTKKSNELIFLPIKENLQDGVLGSIACSKSPWGEKVIKDINNSIKMLRDKDEYKNIFKKWLVPKNNTEDYWKNYQEKIENYKNETSI